MRAHIAQRREFASFVQNSDHASPLGEMPGVPNSTPTPIRRAIVKREEEFEAAQILCTSKIAASDLQCVLRD